MSGVFSDIPLHEVRIMVAEEGKHRQGAYWLGQPGPDPLPRSAKYFNALMGFRSVLAAA